MYFVSTLLYNFSPLFRLCGFLTFLCFSSSSLFCWFEWKKSLRNNKKDHGLLLKFSLHLCGFPHFVLFFSLPPLLLFISTSFCCSVNKTPSNLLSLMGILIFFSFKKMTTTFDLRREGGLGNVGKGYNSVCLSSFVSPSLLLFPFFRGNKSSYFILLCFCFFCSSRKTFLLNILFRFIFQRFPFSYAALVDLFLVRKS